MTTNTTNKLIKSIGNLGWGNCNQCNKEGWGEETIIHKPVEGWGYETILHKPIQQGGVGKETILHKPMQ
jgi:hypothetical protein